MNLHRKIVTVGSVLLITALLNGCGSGSNNNENSSVENEGEGSNIPYLRDNHANYSEHGSTQTPAPTKDANAKSINWTISASTEEGAEKLAVHIDYMTEQLQAGENPRAWDKLFLMEAYMKVNGYYTTEVERSGINVVISKNANTACAYEVISAHSDAVSGDFFAQGDINNDYSSTAESILASSACDAERDSITSYISSRQRGRGN